MTESEAEMVREKLRPLLEDEFHDWRADNGDLLDNGLPGDVVDLWVRFNLAIARVL